MFTSSWTGSTSYTPRCVDITTDRQQFYEQLQTPVELPDSLRPKVTTSYVPPYKQQGKKNTQQPSNNIQSERRSTFTTPHMGTSNVLKNTDKTGNNLCDTKKALDSTEESDCSNVRKEQSRTHKAVLR